MTQSSTVFEYHGHESSPQDDDHDHYPSQFRRFLSLVPLSAAGGIAANSLVNVLLQLASSPQKDFTAVDFVSAAIGFAATFVLLARSFKVFDVR